MGHIHITSGKDQLPYSEGRHPIEMLPLSFTKDMFVITLVSNHGNHSVTSFFSYTVGKLYNTEFLDQGGNKRISEEFEMHNVVTKETG
jgi:hypothetical protein